MDMDMDIANMVESENIEEVLDTVSAFLQAQIVKSKEMTQTTMDEDKEEGEVLNRVSATLQKIKNLEDSRMERAETEIQTDISAMDDSRAKLFSKEEQGACSISTQTDITFPKMWDAEAMAKSVSDNVYIRLKDYLEEAFESERIKVELPHWLKLEQIHSEDAIRASVETVKASKSSERNSPPPPPSISYPSEYISAIDSMIPPVPSLSPHWISTLDCKGSYSLAKKLEDLEAKVKASKEFRIDWQTSKFSRLSPYKPKYMASEIKS